MDQRTRYATTLSRAEQTLGGRDRLARFLNVSPEKLETWLKGEEMPPLEAFLGSLDVIADGPFAGEERPIRVAALREKR
jgi:DNA-binding transcriptional regulator YiaG